MISLRDVLRLMVFMCWSSAICATDTQPRLAIVTSAENNVSNLSLREVRKAFLGIPVVKDGLVVRPLRNLADTVLEQVFLQKVLAMSEPAYEQQVVSLVFRFGGQRPATFTNQEQLIRVLHSTPGAISFMWEDAAKRTASLRVIGLL